MQAGDSRIIVFGGTGHCGRRIVRALADRGVDVRVVSRNAQRASLVLPEGVEIFEGDVTVRDTISTAVRGVDVVVLACRPYIGKQLEIDKRSSMMPCWVF